MKTEKTDSPQRLLQPRSFLASAFGIILLLLLGSGRYINPASAAIAPVNQASAAVVVNTADFTGATYPLSTPITVSPGANVLVVMVGWRDSNVGAANWTFSWGGQPLTQATTVTSQNGVFVGSAIWILNNPAPGSGNLTGSIAQGPNNGGDAEISWMTLSGVDTTAAVVTGVAGTTAAPVVTPFTASATVTVPKAGCFAVENLNMRNANGETPQTFTYTANSGAQTGSQVTYASTSDTYSHSGAGYVGGLPAGTYDLSVTAPNGQGDGTGRYGMAAVVFSPYSPSGPANLVLNGDFEGTGGTPDPDYVTGYTAYSPVALYWPWSAFGGTGTGTGLGNPGGVGLVANPYSDANNSSPTVWADFGNPTYVNTASQNFMWRDWIVPGLTYHVHAQFYIPASELTAGTDTRVGIYFTLQNGNVIRLLNPRYPDDPNNVMSATIPVTNAWYTYDFDWVCPSVDANGNPLPVPTQLNYTSVRWYGGDPTTVSPSAANNYGLSQGSHTNPGGYVDNVQISCASYLTNLSGLVRDNAGNPVSGAQVVLSSTYGGNMETNTTAADGSYAFPRTPALFGYTFTVNASRALYTSGGPQTLAVSASSGTRFPIITLTSQVVTVSGQVLQNSVGLAGVTVTASDLTHSANTVSTTTDGSGNYTVSCAVGDQIQLTATGLPAGTLVTNAPAPFTPADTTPITGKNILVGPDPNYNPNLLFSVYSSSYLTPGGPWPCAFPAGTNLAVHSGSPHKMVINGQNWEWNQRATYDSFQFNGLGAGGLWDAPIACSGASIVVAVRPVRNGQGDSWNSVVDIMYSRLVLGVRNDNGVIQVNRQGDWANGPAIPNGQITVISLVVQPDGTYKVWANGTQVMDITTTGAVGMTSLDPTTSTWGASGTGFWSYINVGRNAPDGWPTFNGNIGDTFVYKIALDDNTRTNLENSLIAKYGTAAFYNITASASGGGSISPSGTISVPDQTSQTFTNITPYGYVLSDVLVDGVSKGAISSYTFTNVSAAHTIASSWVALTTISGTVTGPAGPVFSAFVSLSTNPDGSSPIDTVQSDSSGNYKVVTPNINGTYYLVARKGGLQTSAPLMVVMPGSSVTGKNFTLVTSPTGLDPLVLLDASALPDGPLGVWTNKGTLGGTFKTNGLGSTPMVGSTFGPQAVMFFPPSQNQSDSQSLIGSMPAPPQITGNSDWTISATIYQPSGSTTPNAICAWAGSENGNQTMARFFDCANGGTQVADFYGFGLYLSSVPSFGVFHEMTYTYDGTTAKVYVDGVLATTGTVALNLRPGGMMIVGSADDNDTPGNDNYWRLNGAISKLQIFDQALTSSQVAALAGAPSYNWAGANNADWGNPANWDNSQPAADKVAVLSDASAGATIAVSAQQLLGGIEFNNLVHNTVINNVGGNGSFYFYKSDGITPGSILVDGGSHTINVPLSSPTGLVVTGPGTVAATSDNTFLGTSVSLRVNGGGTFNIAGGTTTIGDGYGVTVDYNGTLGISGTLVTANHDEIIGDSGTHGQVVLSGTGSWTHTGGGVFQVGNDGGPGCLGTVTINDNAVLDLSASGTLNLAVGWGGGSDGTIVQNGGQVKTISVAQAWRTGWGPGVELGEWINGPCHAIYSLNGGILKTPSMGNIAWQGDYTTGTVTSPGTYGGSAILNLNGGVIQATDSDLTDPDAIAEGTAHLIFNTTHTWVQAGGAKIDTAGFTNSIAVSLEHDTNGPALDGGLTKLGLGTLTLLNPSTYTGPTLVQNGTLVCTTVSSLAPSNTLSIASGALVDLAYTGNQNVTNLTINGVSQALGVYGGTGSGAANINAAFTAGPGTVTVVPATLPLPPAPVLLASNYSHPGGVPTFAVNNTVTGHTYTLVYKNNLTDATWTPLTGTGTAPGNGGTISLSDPTVVGSLPAHRFYKIAAQ